MVWGVLIMTACVTVSGQGLFESSLNGNEADTQKDLLTLGGFIRSAVYLGETPLDNEPYLQSAYGEAGLLFKVNSGARASAVADIRFRYGTEWQQPLSEIMLREAYVTLQTGPAEFRLGKLIDPWGKATVFNPVNKLTPMDPTKRSPEEDDMNLGIWALQGSVTLGPYLEVAGTWNPLYQPGKLLIDPIPMPDYVYFVEPDYPGVTLNRSSYGIQLDLRAPAMDAALYGFDGYHGWPGIAFDSFILDSVSMEPQALNIFEKAYRIRMAGADFAIPAGSWILRAEGAWFKTVDNHDGIEYLPFPELSYTAELERGGSWWTSIAGYYGKYILDFAPAQAEPGLSADMEQFLPLLQGGTGPVAGIVDAALREQLASFNRLYNYQLEQVYHSVFLVLKGDFLHSTLEFSVPLTYNITTDEWMARPSLSWMPVDGLSLKAGYQGFWGGNNTLYDLVGPVLNAGFLSMTFKF